jgi:hypothetical protein
LAKYLNANQGQTHGRNVCKLALKYLSQLPILLVQTNKKALNMKNLWTYYNQNSTPFWQQLFFASMSVYMWVTLHPAIGIAGLAFVAYMIAIVYRSEKNFAAWDTARADLAGRYERGELTKEEARIEHNRLTKKHAPNVAKNLQRAFPDSWSA